MTKSVRQHKIVKGGKLQKSACSFICVMTDALEDHEGTVSVGGRTITNLRFADDVDGLAGEEEELANLVECLNKASTAYSMEISAEKTKRMTTNTSGINTEIKANGQKLDTVTSSKYLGSVSTDEGSNPEILSRIAQTAAALTKLKPVWNDMSISLSSKTRLMRSLVASVFLYAFESWALTAELQRRIQAMLPTRKSVPRYSRQWDHTKTT